MKREDKKELTKSKILEAANILIKEKGLEGISVSDITSKAGVAKGSFYIYFKKKEDILSEIACQGLEELYEYIINEAETKDVIPLVNEYMHKFIEGITVYGMPIARSWLKIGMDDEERCYYNENMLNKFFDVYKRRGLIKDLNLDKLVEQILYILFGDLVLWCMDDMKDPYSYIDIALVSSLLRDYMED